MEEVVAKVLEELLKAAALNLLDEAGHHPEELILCVPIFIGLVIAILLVHLWVSRRK